MQKSRVEIYMFWFEGEDFLVGIEIVKLSWPLFQMVTYK